MKFLKAILETSRALGLDPGDPEFKKISRSEFIKKKVSRGLAIFPWWGFGREIFKEELRLLPRAFEPVFEEAFCPSLPSRAFIIDDLPLPLEILLLCHQVCHADFAGRNKIWQPKTKRAGLEVLFDETAKRIEELILTMGQDKINEVLNWAHSIAEQSESLCLINFRQDETGALAQGSLIGEIIKNIELESWTQEILEVFEKRWINLGLPDLETKLSQEAWACFWQKRIIENLDLPAKLKNQCLALHAFLVSGTSRSPLEHNQLALGFRLFKEIEGLGQNIFEILERMNDYSLIEDFFSQKIAIDLLLFFYAPKGESSFTIVGQHHERFNYQIVEYAKKLFPEIKKTLLGQVGLNQVPQILIEEINDKENTLVLRHILNQGRLLDEDYAVNTAEYLGLLCRKNVLLKTFNVQTFSTGTNVSHDIVPVEYCWDFKKRCWQSMRARI